MKVNINFCFKDVPHGGANQFLKALKSNLETLGLYSEDRYDADIILFNSHHNVQEVFYSKILYPNKIYVHRIDGPMRLYNNMADNRDSIVYKLNYDIASANVFQSDWSHKSNISLGFESNKPYTIIHNAPDPLIFNTIAKSKRGKKNKLIATSWSNNIKKGFKYYDFLDKNLDFDKYEFSFAGRSPIQFKNIKMLGPLDSLTLSTELKNHDAFITASENDPCSNSLVESLTCGLPVIALNSGGHPELVKEGGVLFNNETDLIEKITMLFDDLENYKKNISIDSIDQVVEKYIMFFEKLLQGDKNG